MIIFSVLPNKDHLFLLLHSIQNFPNCLSLCTTNRACITTSLCKHSIYNSYSSMNQLIPSFLLSLQKVSIIFVLFPSLTVLAWYHEVKGTRLIANNICFCRFKLRFPCYQGRSFAHVLCSICSSRSHSC